MYFRICVIKNFAMFIGKHLCWSVFFNKYKGLKACNFNKNRLQHKLFPVQFAKFLRTPFFTEHVRRLLLEISCELPLNCIWEQRMVSFRGTYVHSSACFVLLRVFRFFLFPYFLFFFFSYFHSWILLVFGFEVSLSMLKIKQWSCF